MKGRVPIVCLLLAVTAVIWLTGCAKSEKEESAYMEQRASSQVAEKAAPTAGKVQPVAYETPEQGAFAAAVSARKVITSAYRTVKVEDVKEGYERAVRIVQDAGGFVQSSQMERGTVERERRAELVLRVPAASLEKVMQGVEGLGQVLLTRVEGEDVTEKWVDLGGRIRNLKREEEVLLDILGRRARSLGEVLEVERELARVRGEIEQSEGRLRMLSEQVALATLHLTLVESEVAVEAIPAGLWAMKGTVTHAARAAMKTARAIVGIVIWLGIWGVVWVPALALFVGARFALRKARRASGLP